jgi:hypothetical protein
MSRHLIDGTTAWGSFAIGPGRYGITRYQLVVYPPGISDTERRRVRIWRGWPLWGAALWLVCLMVLCRWVDPWAAIVLATAAYLAGGAAAFVRVGAVRGRVRTAGAVVSSDNRDLAELLASHKIRALAAEMKRADALLAAGVLSLVEHETIWWRVYETVAVVRARNITGTRR